MIENLLLIHGQVQFLEAFREIDRETEKRAANLEMHISMYSCKNYIYYLFLFLNLCLRENEHERGEKRKLRLWFSQARAIPFCFCKIITI